MILSAISARVSRVVLESADGWIDCWMDGWMDGWMEWMDGWMDGWIQI